MAKMWSNAPGLADVRSMAISAFDALPKPFQELCSGIDFEVQEFADPSMLSAMGIGDRYAVIGAYDGMPLGRRLRGELPEVNDIVWIFRRPLLDEWAEQGTVALERLVERVVVHEVANHFGFSDHEIDAIESWQEEQRQSALAS